MLRSIATRKKRRIRVVLSVRNVILRKKRKHYLDARSVLRLPANIAW